MLERIEATLADLVRLPADGSALVTQLRARPPSRKPAAVRRGPVHDRPARVGATAAGVGLRDGVTEPAGSVGQGLVRPRLAIVSLAPALSPIRPPH